jgi:hypothetical protein
MDDIERFRIFFWQKVAAPVVALPVFAFLVAISPVADGWSNTTWIVIGGVAGGVFGVYFWSAWRRALVTLDGEGMTSYLAEGRTLWRYEKLLKVKQIGNYRVRMCWDPDIEGKHMHISFDFLQPARFIDALLDRYAESTGHELPQSDEELAA